MGVGKSLNFPEGSEQAIHFSQTRPRKSKKMAILASATKDS